MKAVRLVLLVGGLACLAGAALAGNTYKWTDDKGQIQYTQLPPNDRPYTVIKSAASPVNENATEESSTSLTSKPADKANPKASAGEYTSAEKEKLSKNCDIAKQNREMLRTAAKIRVTDEKGEPRHLTEEERKARLADTEKQIAFYCDK